MGVEKLNWADARILMHKANPEFVALLDTVDGIDKYEFTKYSYRYGDLICDADYFYDPDGNIVADNIPFGMVVEKSMHFFMELGGKVISGPVRKEGDLSYLNYFRLADYPDFIASWSLTAGDRDPVIVPTYKEKLKYLKVQQALNIDGSINYSDDFSILKLIAKGTKNSWRMVYVGISEELSAYLKTSPKCWQIREYLYKELMSIRQANNIKNLVQEMVLNYIKVHHCNIKNFFYLSNIVNHIFDSISGQSMMHRLSDDDQSLPLFDIQKVFEEIYQPKHPPLILVSSNYKEEFKKDHFFSIQHHTDLYRPEHIPNIISLCVMVKNLVFMYAEEAQKIPFVHKSSQISCLADKVSLTVINDRPSTHNEVGESCLLKDIQEMSTSFKNQFQEFKEKNPDYQFPVRSNFFSGSFLIRGL
ncbi:MULTISPECIES: hypothetical protein [Cysteiniphilum]|uniref:Uncharacterized protein n=1 Tax=Cysteiniphilum litorale TaxID=2056700 RepID=A0A8J3E8J9_9GAMM|nr:MULTISPECIES: hypothetical protein [Cysteiniphilum]GGF94049.1 hypothetical protein GCM10010995_09090 [Cysteiniphilum litorale]